MSTRLPAVLLVVCGLSAPALSGDKAERGTKKLEGTWTLVISVRQGPNDAATALVELGPDGEVASVKVPTEQRGSWTVPRQVSINEVNDALRARAATLARKS